MLTFARVEPIPYDPPWTADLEGRISALCAGERRIAYFYNQPDTGTFRYRVLNMIEALAAAPSLGISAAWFTRADLRHAERFISRTDVLVICRTHYDAAINRLIGMAKARGIRVYFDVDDLTFDPDYVHLMLETLDQPSQAERTWTAWFGAVARLGATLRLCDGAIVPNQFLAERVSAYAPSVIPRIIPNYLNRAQQEISESIWHSKRQSGFARDGRIHLGYFSGTPTHNRDFEIISSVLSKLLDKDRRIALRIAGFMQLKSPLVRHRDRIETYPFQDFLNLQQITGAVEINLAPLQINTFTNCKSELKYFESAIVGTPTIASPTFAFRTAIRDGQNGFLAHAHEWEDKIRTALDCVSAGAQYADLAECAYLHAREAYNWNRYATNIDSAVFGGREERSDEQILDRAANTEQTKFMLKASSK